MSKENKNTYHTLALHYIHFSHNNVQFVFQKSILILSATKNSDLSNNDLKLHFKHVKNELKNSLQKKLKMYLQNWDIDQN